VKAAIDGWLADLVSSALNPVLQFLGRTLLSSPDPSVQPRVRELWTASQVAANTVAVLFILAGGVLVMTRESLQSRYSMKEVAPRLVVGVVAANLSLQLVGPSVQFANALTGSIVGGGLDPTATGQRLTQLLIGSSRDGGSFLLLLALVAAVMGVVVVVSATVRIAVTILLTIGAPLFLICHASPATEGLAVFWWKAMAGCFGIQVAQAATLLAALRIFFTPDGFDLLGTPTDSTGLVSLLVAVCLMWILARIPSWVFRMVFQPRRSTVVGIVRSVVIVRGLRAVGVLRH
jgi:hypothetical protein